MGKIKFLSICYCMIAVLMMVACGGGNAAPTPTPTPTPSNNSVPVVTSLSPSSVIAGAGATTVTINGSGFISSSSVQWGTAVHASTPVSGTQIQVALSASEVATAGSATVTVTNPAPGGGTSTSSTFTVNNPAPVVSAISPATVMVGSIGSTITVSGSGFVSGSVVNFNGSPRTTTFSSSTSLRAALTAADYQTSGVPQITVSNPAPGGGTSSASTAMSVINPTPVLSNLSPSNVTAGSAQTVVTLNGSGFMAGSVVRINGAARSATFVSSTKINVTLTAAELANPTSLQFTVSNAGPGGGTSYGLSFAVRGATPTITIYSMSPSMLPAGYGDFSLFVTASGLTYNTQATWNGSARQTYAVDPYYGYLLILIDAADIQNPGSAQVVLSDPTTGAVSAPQSFIITAMGIVSVDPNEIYAGSAATTLDVKGGGFNSGAIVQWNGAPLATTFVSAGELTAIVPASDLAVVADASVTVLNPDNSVSNEIPVPVLLNPVPTASSLSPNSAPIGSGSLILTIWGNGFTNSSVVEMNGTTVASTFKNAGQLQVNLTAQQLQTFGTFRFTVTNSAPGGGTTTPLSFSTYLGLQTNDLIYDSWSGLLYASIPSAAGSMGNRIVAIDPATGNLVSSVFVGSEPNKLALSSDGKSLWAGIDGAAAVRKIDLVTMTAGLQFGLGGGAGVYNSPNTAFDIAVMPGFSDTIAVSLRGNYSSTGLSIYDSGVARTNTYSYYNGPSPIVFDPSGTKLYLYDGSFVTMTIDSTGVASYTRVTETLGSSSVLRYDNGRIYTSGGTVLNSATGALLGTFYGSSYPANGYVAPDSANGRAFILAAYYSSDPTILAFDSNTFTSAGSLNVAGIDTSTNATSLVRWGQNGLAFRTQTQIYVLQTPLVKDLSSTPADLNVTLSGTANASTGSTVTYTATVTNNGPNAAHNVVVINAAPDNSTPLTAVPTQGTCVSGAVTRCNLGTINSGSSAQVVMTATVLTSGIATDSVSVSATEPDPTTANNTSTANTSVTGVDNSAAPAISSVSPSFVMAGGSSFTLTVSGSNFNLGSSIQWNGIGLATTFTDANTLTATVDAAKIALLGYSWVNVSTPAPGGGTTAALPVTFYSSLAVDLTKMVYDPFSRKIYATVPSTATQLTGNSVVAIDPGTGTVSTPVNVGSQPSPLALSDDGRYLFVGLNGSNSIARFNLAANATDMTFPADSFGAGLTVRSLAVAPGNSNLLAVDYGSWAGNGIVDIAGGTGTRRANLTGPYTGSNISFMDSTHVFTYDSDTSGAEFYRWNVTANGFTQIDASTLNGIGGFQGAFQFAKGTVFGIGGGVVNPSTTPPSMIGKFNVGYPTGIAADPWNGRVFFLGCSIYMCSSPSSNVVTAYDESTFVPSGNLPFTIPGQVDTLIRWGNDGLAFRVSTDFWSAGTDQLIVLRGPFVVPQLGVAHATGSITSLSPNSVSAGGTNGFYISVTGTGFVPGAVAKWNGADRTTYFVDSTHLSVAIPASDVSAAGSAAVTVLNPGAASAASAATFTIN